MATVRKATNFQAPKPPQSLFFPEQMLDSRAGLCSKDCVNKILYNWVNIKVENKSINNTCSWELSSSGLSRRE